MASGKSNALRDAILNHILGGGDYTRVANVHVALYTVAPTAAGGGTEVSGGDYARAALANDATNFPAASGGSKSNGTLISFPQASADWGTVVAVGIHSHATNDELIYWGTLGTSKAVISGAVADFQAGSLVFNEV